MAGSTGLEPAASAAIFAGRKMLPALPHCPFASLKKKTSLVARGWFVTSPPKMIHYVRGSIVNRSMAIPRSRKNHRGLRSLAPRRVCSMRATRVGENPNVVEVRIGASPSAKENQFVACRVIDCRRANPGPRSSRREEFGPGRRATQPICVGKGPVIVERRPAP